MPHFHTWDNIFYDYVRGGDLLKGTRSLPTEQLVLNYEEIKQTFD